MTITHEKYLEAIDIVKQYRQQCVSTIKMIDTVIVDENTLLSKSTLSVRALNILRIDLDIDINSSRIKDLQNISLKKLKKIRNCGVKTRMEIVNLCDKAGITLKN